MDNKEAKVECLKLALEYAKIWNSYHRESLHVINKINKYGRN